MSFLLAEYATEPIDVPRVTKMLLLHDVIEIDAGDTFAYDVAANIGRAERERRGAERIFGLLPEKEGARVASSVEEFEEFKTPESKYATRSIVFSRCCTTRARRAAPGAFIPWLAIRSTGG